MDTMDNKLRYGLIRRTFEVGFSVHPSTQKKLYKYFLEKYSTLKTLVDPSSLIIDKDDKIIELIKTVAILDVIIENLGDTDIKQVKEAKELVEGIKEWLFKEKKPKDIVRPIILSILLLVFIAVIIMGGV